MTKKSLKSKVPTRSMVISFDSYRDWEKVLKGDRDTFKRITEPFLTELIDAAGREIRYQVFLDKLDEDTLTPEELIGETLIRAWEHRAKRPDGMSLKGWLLAVQRLTLGRIMAKEKDFRRYADISLESPIPKEPIYDDGASYWEWHQPDDFNRWEDLIPDDMPTPEEMVAEHEAAVYGMEADERDALYFYNEHQLSIQEIAYIMRRTVENTVSMLESASESYRRAVDIKSDTS